MTSNDDLMKYLQSMEEKRAKEREADRKEMKEMRIREREEDMDEIKKIINSSIGEKVKEAVAPFEEKTETVVKVQDEMKQQMNSFMNQMKDLQERVSKVDAGSYPPAVDSGSVMAGGVFSGSSAGRAKTLEISAGVPSSDQALEIISLSRRTVGLHSIDEGDLERMKQQQFGGATNEEEEKLYAVQEYLRCELKLTSEILAAMEIEKIFTPPGRDTKYLFVTFKNESSLTRIFEKTRIMRKGSRIINYIPAQFRDRARAIGDIEYELRHRENFQTRIKMGLKDLELWKKVRGMNQRWERVDLPSNLPPVDMNVTADRPDLESLSPPPGRPGQSRKAEKRGRGSSGSEAGSEKKNPKTSRLETSWSETLEKADLVGESNITPTKPGEGLQRRPDTGFVFSVIGTPNKPSLAADYRASPVISRSEGNRYRN